MNEIINIMDKGDVKRNIITQMTSPGKDLLSVHTYLLYSLSFENGIFFFGSTFHPNISGAVTENASLE